MGTMKATKEFSVRPQNGPDETCGTTTRAVSPGRCPPMRASLVRRQLEVSYGGQKKKEN
jgi:hypothetical protein